MSTITIRSIDIGFSLRTLNMPVQIPPGTTGVFFDSLSDDGVDRGDAEVHGTIDEIRKALHEAGYSTRVTQ